VFVLEIGAVVNSSQRCFVSTRIAAHGLTGVQWASSPLHSLEARVDGSSEEELPRHAGRCLAKSVGGPMPEASRQGASPVQVQCGLGVGVSGLCLPEDGHLPA
jgi:hypothetical protein